MSALGIPCYSLCMKNISFYAFFNDRLIIITGAWSCWFSRTLLDAFMTVYLTRLENRETQWRGGNELQVTNWNNWASMVALFYWYKHSIVLASWLWQYFCHPWSSWFILWGGEWQKWQWRILLDSGFASVIIHGIKRSLVVVNLLNSTNHIPIHIECNIYLMSKSRNHTRRRKRKELCKVNCCGVDKNFNKPPQQSVNINQLSLFHHIFFKKWLEDRYATTHYLFAFSRNWNCEPKKTKFPRI